MLYVLSNWASRLRDWWFWFSPPWKRTRRCPGCAGEKRYINSYTERDCDICQGRGVVPKLTGVWKRRRAYERKHGPLTDDFDV